MDKEERAHFLRMPPEILEKIFLSTTLKEKELCYLSSTCSAFRDVLLVNELWRLKFLQRWPELQSRLQNFAKESQVCWRSLYRDRFLLKKDVIDKLKDLSRKTHNGDDKALLILEEGKFYDFDSMPVFSKLPEESLDHEQRVDLTVSELLEVCHDGNNFQKLNTKYFAEKSLAYLRHMQFESDIKAFASRPSEEKDIEEGAVFIAQWFQPTLTFSLEDIKRKLDRLAVEVRTTLFDMHPSHPIFSTGFEVPHTGNLTESLWGVHDSRLILSAIEQTLKPLLRKDANMQQYYVAENSFINLVVDLYRGIPITLSLLAMVISHRLGFLLQPVNFPRHFILRWMEHPTRTGIDRFSFVDVFNGNYSMTYADVVENFSLPDQPISVQNCDSCMKDDVLQRMLRNLVALGRQSHQGGDMMLLHHACQLYMLFHPQDLRMNLLEIQIQLHMGINLPRAVFIIQDLATAIPWMSARLSQLESSCQHAIKQAERNDTDTKPKRRRSFREMKYSVGMVMQHRRYDYFCVIYGWDNVCKASQDWIVQMGVNEQQKQHPFYNVLVMDGTNRYASEENLKLTLDACQITHPMVGLYFDSFSGRYYTPCESIHEQYPEDAEVTCYKISEFFFFNSNANYSEKKVN